jgi:hypothetical protein
MLRDVSEPPPSGAQVAGGGSEPACVVFQTVRAIVVVATSGPSMTEAAPDDSGYTANMRHDGHDRPTVLERPPGPGVALGERR